MNKALEQPEVPFFWPAGLAVGAIGASAAAAKRNLAFLKEVAKTQIERPRPQWATKHALALELHTLRLLDFSRPAAAETATLILPPYAGHSSTIADFHKGQSLIETLQDNGIGRLFSIDWKSATPQMKDYDIDHYLAELNVVVDDLGGAVKLVGLCQGGWLAAMYAARYPAKVRALLVGGSPIDTAGGDGMLEQSVKILPMSFYETLVRIGGGLLKGAFMLRGFKNMHPDQQYFKKFADLYENIDDPEYVHRFEDFERWYESTVDLPGRWYLQVIHELFKENRFYRGEFVGLGRKLSLRAIVCPVYLLAGEADDITPPEQVFNAAKHLGTDKASIVKTLVAGGHIGLFMSHRTLREQWPRIAQWLSAAAAA
jgi:poly(3-hydroxybutyrate) depolymerase